ncbi:MAG: hypothetical protein OXU68_11025 [Bacteroidota bacterium]|nr:hypothetical protein [Bacteroidota bacterium]
MTESAVYAFAFNMAAEVLRAQHPESEFGRLSISLYDLKTGQEAYNIHYDPMEEDYCLCRVLKSEPAAQFGDGPADLFFSSEVEVITAWQTSEEAAGALIELALQENLMPQINYMLNAEPSLGGPQRPPDTPSPPLGRGRRRA